MPETRQQKELKQIEAKRESRLLVYFTGDRQPFGARIAEDVVRPVYDHLLALEKLEPKRNKLDMFLYSRGGDVSIPWRLITMFRQVFEEFNVLVPYKKMYSHGHAIGRKEAKEIGLPIEEPAQEVEKLMWQLFEEYEKELDLRNNIDPETELRSVEEKPYQDLPLAIIESSEKLHRFETQAIFRKKRNIPNNPQINVNLNVGLPPNMNQQQIPQQLQQAINQ